MRLRGAQGHLLKCKLQGPAPQALIQDIQTTRMRESGLPGPSRGSASPSGPSARGGKRGGRAGTARASVRTACPHARVQCARGPPGVHTYTRVVRTHIAAHPRTQGTDAGVGTRPRDTHTPRVSCQPPACFALIQDPPSHLS